MGCSADRSAKPPSEKKSKGKIDLISSPVPDQVVIRNKHTLESEEKEKEKR